MKFYRVLLLIFLLPNILKSQAFDWNDSLRIKTVVEKVNFYETVAEHFRSENISLAEQYAYKMLLLAKAKNLQKMIIRAHLILADIYMYKSPEKTHHEYTEAKKLAENTNNYALLVEVLQQQAIYYTRWHQYDEASLAIREYIALIRKHNLPRELPYETQGYMYAQQGNTKKALKYYHQYKAYSESKDKPNYIDVLTEIGNTHYKNKNYDSARIYYLKRLEIAKKYQNQRDCGYLYDNVGLTFYRQNKYKASIPWHQKGLFYRRKLKSELDVIVNLTNLGRSYLAHTNTDSAYLYLSEAYARALRFHYHDFTQQAAHHLGTLFSETKQMDSAYFYQSQAYLYLDSVRQERQEEATKGAATKLDIAQEQFKNKLLASKNTSLQLIGGIVILVLLLIIIAGLFFLKQHFIRKKLLAELQESNDTKAHLFSIIAHDLRSPLMAFQGIKSQIDYFLRKKQAQRLRELGSHIERSSMNIATLLDNLLNWALTEQKQLEPKFDFVNLENIIHDIVENYKLLAEIHGIKLVTNIESNIVISTDKNILHTVLRNIVNNALKYTPEDGTISIKSVADTKKVEVQIKDTGIGINPQKLQSLFCLYSGKSERGIRGEKGTGLGLNLSYQFVKMLRGDLKVSSQKGKGSTFTIQLPKQL